MPVEHITPRRLKRSSIIASRAVMMTGICSGRQPAMTALTAMRSTVARPPKGGSSAINSSPPRPVWATNLRTNSSDGGTTGKPSVHPVSNINSMASVISVESIVRSHARFTRGVLTRVRCECKSAR